MGRTKENKKTALGPARDAGDVLGPARDADDSPQEMDINETDPQDDPHGNSDDALGWQCRRHVGDMSATRRNVANFRADRGNLATWIPVCRHTFVSRFPDIDGPRTDDIWMCMVLIPTFMLI